MNAIDLADAKKSLMSMPLAKVLSAFFTLNAGYLGTVSKAEAIEWILLRLSTNACTWSEVMQASLAKAGQTTTPAPAPAADRIAQIEQAWVTTESNVTRVAGKVEWAITSLQKTEAKTDAQRQDIADALQKYDNLSKKTDDLNAELSSLNRKLGQFSLDEAMINNAVTQVIDDAFAPFRKAVEDAGLQETIADMTQVRVIERRPALEVFGVDVRDMKGNPLMVDVWNHPNAPAVDPLFIWTPGILSDLLGVQETGENLWFGGDRGTGKSETARQFAARTGRNFARVNYHKHSSADEFIGSVGIENGATVFKPGSFLQAYLTPSTVILNDEISNAPEGELATLNPLLEPNCAVVYGGAVRRRAPGVMIFAADNTLGSGDESGRYAGTRTMNSALIDRFARVIHFQYLPLTDEVRAVVNHTQCPEELAAHVLACVHIARSKVSDGEIIDAPSIRSVIAFIRALKTKSIQDAWMSCIVNRQPTESKSALIALAETCLDQTLINRNL